MPSTFLIEKNNNLNYLDSSWKTIINHNNYEFIELNQRNSIVLEPFENNPSNSILLAFAIFFLSTWVIFLNSLLTSSSIGIIKLIILLILCINCLIIWILLTICLFIL